MGRKEEQQWHAEAQSIENGPHSTIKENSKVLPWNGPKENYEGCVSVQFGVFSSLGSYWVGM